MIAVSLRVAWQNMLTEGVTKLHSVPKKGITDDMFMLNVSNRNGLAHDFGQDRSAQAKTSVTLCGVGGLACNYQKKNGLKAEANRGGSSEYSHL